MSATKHTEEIEISDSSEEVHPNIDRKSFKNWKRQMAEEQKMKLKMKLEELNNCKKLTEEEIKEKEKIEELLKPQYVVVNEDEFRVGNEDVDKHRDYSDELVSLLKNTNLEYFIDLVSTSKMDLNVFEDFVLYNLSENIKEGCCDEIGLKLSKISLFAGYVKSNGYLLVSRLCDELKNPEKSKIFEEDVKRYYEESKHAILNLK